MRNGPTIISPIGRPRLKSFAKQFEVEHRQHSCTIHGVMELIRWCLPIVPGVPPTSGNLGLHQGVHRFHYIKISLREREGKNYLKWEFTVKLSTVHHIARSRIRLKQQSRRHFIVIVGVERHRKELLWSKTTRMHLQCSAACSMSTPQEGRIGFKAQLPVIQRLIQMPVVISCA